MSSRDASLWKEAINDEMDSVMGNGTWVLADLPKGTRPIGSKRIFKRKRNLDGSISAFKVRFVAKGYRQKEGVDYLDTYAQVARIGSIRTLIEISTLKELKNPFESCVKLEKYSGRAVAQLEYASAIGCMMYAMHYTALDPYIYFAASKKQTCIAHWTMEAKFIALSAAGKEAEWIRDLLTNLHFRPRPTPSILMYCDGKATLSKVYNSIYNGKL
ncbi:hypothetical protein OSB04_029448 [Centaurea solstitialis]|uniref:Reverse transcriptase Ty1/copia-type domain-containing protein n=1 Tax=Centaurea solstitialis TaxID=347529 RepID=A0AA38W1J8_9ASTR|nr:hypothetical protein OSB04_029448 [Centaurea solstitialis]